MAAPRPLAEFSEFAAPVDRAVKLDGEAKRRLDRGRQRLALLSVAFLAGFLVLSGRLVQLAWPAAGDDAVRDAKANPAPIVRAPILDRNGQLLATNLSVASLFADPTEIWDVAETVEKLTAIFPDLDAQDLARRLASERRFEWIRRDLTPKQQSLVHGLGLPGLHFKREERRFYLQGRTLAHVLGDVDIDNRGVMGLERALDERLGSGDAAALTLSIDLGTQHALRHELHASMQRFAALGAAGLLMDAQSGEILALASLPDFDPNLDAAVDANARFNRVTLGVYEMGSTFKALTTAMALDTGRINLHSGFDASKPIVKGRHVINDYHPENRWLTVREIFLHSSNIGSARMAMTVGVDAHRAFLGRLGLFDRPAIEIAEVAAPLVPDPWGEIHSMTISFGHGMAVSPVQLVKAAAPLVNGGFLVEPTLLRVKSPPRRRAVLRSETSRAMVGLLRHVVEKGTGKQADVPGYAVGGKTGTAEKAAGRGYRRDALMTSFLATFPTQAPRYVLLVMLDEPKATAETHGYATAGWNAAPTAARVIERVAPILRVSPTWTADDTLMAASEGSHGRHASR